MSLLDRLSRDKKNSDKSAESEVSNTQDRLKRSTSILSQDPKETEIRDEIPQEEQVLPSSSSTETIATEVLDESNIQSDQPADPVESPQQVEPPPSPPPRKEEARAPRSADAATGRLRQEKKLILLEKVIAVHKMLIEEGNLELTEDELRTTDRLTKDQIRKDVENEIKRVIDKDSTYAYMSRSERNELINAVVDETIGLGPLEKLIAEEDITEIMVNGPQQTYVEYRGKLQLADITFKDNDHLKRIIDKIVGQVGRRIDEAMPMVDARLLDGSRVNAIIPPLALKGPTLTIRKFSKDPFQASDLIKFGSMTPEIAKFLRACVEGHLNCIVSGGTGSGKTTLLNVLSSFIPPEDRIITVEDSAELQLQQDHVVTLESRPPNMEGKGEVSIRDLIRNCLRMRPERIVVGEVRGGEALDMLQAMNTGHDGSLTTGHANTPRDMVARLETMVMMAGMDMPVKAIRQQIASAFHLIVQQARLKDGSRKITEISEVTGMEGDIVTMQPIFRYVQTGMDADKKVVGHFEATGVIPSFYEKLEAQGVDIHRSLFDARNRNF